MCGASVAAGYNSKLRINASIFVDVYWPARVSVKNAAGSIKKMHHWQHSSYWIICKMYCQIGKTWFLQNLKHHTKKVRS